MRKAHPAPPPPKLRLARVLLLGAAVVLSIGGAVQLYGLWLRLPGVRWRHATAEAYTAALRAAEARMSPQARQGLIAANVSNLFTAVYMRPEPAGAYRPTLERMLGQLRDTQLGRLQLAAFLMLEMERAGTPVEQWWPTLQPLLPGHEQASPSHFLGELIDHRTGLFRSLGFGPASAWASADRAVGHPHGPLLQFLVSRLERLATAREAAADGSAESCRRLVRRLLRQWTLDAAPAGLRLLAADLLAHALDGPAADADARELAAQLRAWREAYRVAAAPRPVPLPLVGLREAPEPRPAVYERLLADLFRVMWAAALTLAAAVVALAAVAVSWRTMWRTSPGRTAWLASPLIALALVVAGGAWLLGDGRLGQDDLRRLGYPDLGWPHAPLAAAGLVVIVVWGGPLLLAGRATEWGVRWRRVADLATLVWLFLALTLAVCGALAAAELRGYESWPGGVAAGGEIEAIAGVEAARHLEALSAWTP